MNDTPKSAMDAFGPMTYSMEKLYKIQMSMMSATTDQVRVAQMYWKGVYKYLNEFMEPFEIAKKSFMATEGVKAKEKPLLETLKDYWELFQFNLQVGEKGFSSSLKLMSEYHMDRLAKASNALLNTLSDGDEEDIADFAARELALLEKVVVEYPTAINAIEPEYGFHFDDGYYDLTVETDRFNLFQVLPRDGKTKVNNKMKPIIIAHPYVLGANIIGFLPDERKSYVHAFADQGIPTYVRVLKDIDTTPAVQTMTGEDDCLDTKLMCEKLVAKHGKKVTLNGFCQGGFIVCCDILSGELDGLVDALITCVSPMDGTKSLSLVEYLEHLPDRFRDLGYAVKTLENGNQVVDGKVMSWVYKLKSMEREAPIFSFYRDLKMFDKPNIEQIKISKTAAAINYWLIYDRNDLPEAITKMSFDSYTYPVKEDGTLPVKLFGRELNFKYLEQKKISTLICYAARDDLVDKPTALAPTSYINHAELTEFPKGHGAMATSWSNPDSACALHTVFGENKQRGPARFHMDLDAALDKKKPSPKKSRKKK
jgi:hypothetical protein